MVAVGMVVTASNLSSYKSFIAKKKEVVTNSELGAIAHDIFNLDHQHSPIGTLTLTPQSHK
jgi:hypothetical protein